MFSSLAQFLLYRADQARDERGRFTAEGGTPVNTAHPLLKTITGMIRRTERQRSQKISTTLEHKALSDQLTDLRNKRRELWKKVAAGEHEAILAKGSADRAKQYAAYGPVNDPGERVNPAARLLVGKPNEEPSHIRYMPSTQGERRKDENPAVSPNDPFSSFNDAVESHFAKAVGPTETPVTAYHASPEKISSFDTSLPGNDNKWGPGAYFSYKPEDSTKFQGNKPGFLHQVEITPKKSLDVSGDKQISDDDFSKINENAKSAGLKPIRDSLKNSPARAAYNTWYRDNDHNKSVVNDVLKKSGFDAIKDDHEFVSLDPSNIKIKSATPLNQSYTKEQLQTPASKLYSAGARNAQAKINTPEKISKEAQAIRYAELNEKADQHVNLANYRAKLAQAAKRAGNTEQAQKHFDAMNDHYAKARDLRKAADPESGKGTIMSVKETKVPGSKEMPLLFSRYGQNMSRDVKSESDRHLENAADALSKSAASRAKGDDETADAHLMEAGQHFSVASDSAKTAKEYANAANGHKEMSTAYKALAGTQMKLGKDGTKYLQAADKHTDASVASTAKATKAKDAVAKAKLVASSKPDVPFLSHFANAKHKASA